MSLLRPLAQQKRKDIFLYPCPFYPIRMQVWWGGRGLQTAKWTESRLKWPLCSQQLQWTYIVNAQTLFCAALLSMLQCSCALPQSRPCVTSQPETIGNQLLPSRCKTAWLNHCALNVLAFMNSSIYSFISANTGHRQLRHVLVFMIRGETTAFNPEVECSLYVSETVCVHV